MYRGSESKDLPVAAATFPDGYSVRNVLCFFRQTCTQANIIFEPERITIKEADTSRTILADCQINTLDLTEYQYNAFDEDGELIPAVFCGFNTLEMQKATRMVGKKDSIKLYTKREKNPKLYIQVIHSSSKSDNSLGLRIVDIIDVDMADYADIHYKRRLPNSRAASTDFAKICGDFSTLKCNYINVIVFDEGIMFQGIEGGAVRSVETYGKIQDKSKIAFTATEYEPHPEGSQKPRLVVTQPGEICRIRISSKTIRAMTKFNNLSPTGVIKFFMEKDMPLMILSPIGCYGKLTLYINDSDPE